MSVRYACPIPPPRKAYTNTICPVRRTARIRRQRWIVGEHTCACLQIPSVCFTRTEHETHDGRKHRETNYNTERTNVEEKGRGRRDWRQTEDLQNRIKSCDLAYGTAIENATHKHDKTCTHNRYRV